MLVIMLRKAGVNSQVEIPVPGVRDMGKIALNDFIRDKETPYQRSGYTIVRCVVYI